MLDDAALVALRDVLAEIHLADEEVPRHLLVKLGQLLPSDVGLTIDMSAIESLGHPIVVVRPRSMPDYGLSPREREVAGLVATGLRNKDIAIALGISVGTVKDHVHKILTKTGADSRAGVAALWAGLR